MHFSTKPSVTGNESEHQKEDAQELANKSLGESSLSWHGKEENYLSVVFVFSTSKLLQFFWIAYTLKLKVAHY